MSSSIIDAIKSRPKPRIPSLGEVSEDYTANYAKLMGLYKVQADLQRKIQEIATAQRDRAKARFSPSSSKPTPEIPNERVAAILGEELEAQADAPLTPQEEQAKLSQEEADVKDAIAVVGKRLEAARMAASAIICKQLEPEMHAIVSDLAETMAQVSHLALQYRQLANDLNSANVAWSQMEVMGINVGGTFTQSSPFVQWLIAASERGFVDPKSLPREIFP